VPFKASQPPPSSPAAHAPARRPTLLIFRPSCSYTSPLPLPSDPFLTFLTER
jgi:hypothetical protein